MAADGLDGFLIHVDSVCRSCFLINLCFLSMQYEVCMISKNLATNYFNSLSNLVISVAETISNRSSLSNKIVNQGGILDEVTNQQTQFLFKGNQSLRIWAIIQKATVLITF